MPTDRFTEQQLIDCLERLSPEARERLGWRKIGGKWALMEPDSLMQMNVPVSIENMTYADHAAVLAEVLIELYKRGELPEYDVETEKWVGVARPHGDEYFFDTIFTAVHAAFMEVCK